MIYAQTDANDPTPALPALSLKDSVARVILKDQRDLAAAQTQQLQLLQQYQENQTSQQTLAKKLQAELATALKDSGLDSDANLLDPTSLAVVAKPKPVTPPAPVKPAVSAPKPEKK